jgi:sigma-B regulation protein RsbU (phosphoserine phosphatase)
LKTRQPGLGLGLYVCAEIARAHGGDLTAPSTQAETRFTFSMPLA